VTTIPTIKATPTKSGRQLEFYCVHCRTKHFHGVGDDDGAGHRAAHCWWAGSPYMETGYTLEVQRSDQPCVNVSPDAVPAVSRRRRRTVATAPATALATVTHLSDWKRRA
jgi:hypothetical protein